MFGLINKVEKSKNGSFKTNMKIVKVIHSLSPSLFTLTIIKSVFGTLIPYIDLYMSAEIINELGGRRDINKLTLLIIITIGSHLVVSVLKGLFDKLYSDAHNLFYESERIFFASTTLNMNYSDIENPDVHQLRREIFNATMIDNHGSGQIIDISSRLMNNITELILSLIIFAQLFVLLLKNGVTTIHIIFISVIVIFIILTVSFKFHAEKLKSRQSMNFTKLNSYGQRINSGLYSYNIGKDIRLYRLDKIILKIKKDYVNLSKQHYNNMNMFDFLMGIPEIAIKKILQACMYIFVCILAIGDIIQIGDIVKYIGCLQRFSSNITDIFYSVSALKYNTQFLENYLKFLDIPSEIIKNGKEHIDTIDYNIELKNVSFKYPSSDTYALQDVSLTIKSGEHLAVVGMNGSGKTTFIKLLCRLYDPDEGEILLNGKNIKEYNYDEYMAMFSILFQDFKLFAFPLGENIALHSIYNKQLVEQCLENVGFGEKYNNLEKGLETYLYKDFDENGIEISGGEAQKIALARILYKNSPLIILDEPTSALDPISEYEIYSKFNKIAKNKTAVFISHRLSSCRFCENIAVFHEGKLIQHGNHENLIIDEGGKYYSLWTAQAQYYVTA